jgi:hypothetical protein
MKPKMDDRLVFELDLADYRSAEDFEISIWDTMQMLFKHKMQTERSWTDTPPANSSVAS